MAFGKGIVLHSLGSPLHMASTLRLKRLSSGLVCLCYIYFISFGLDEPVHAMTQEDSAALGSAVRRTRLGREYLHLVYQPQTHC